MNKKNIFISYSWENMEIANEIEKDLELVQFNFKRDVHDIEYKSSISSFMEEIRNSDFALILISDSYLKSKNCMKEVLHILKEKDFKDKILPIIVDRVSIYTSEGRLGYTTYWQTEKQKLEALISSLAATSIIKEIEELKAIENITSTINEFLSYISDIKNIKFDELKKENYKSILESLGGVDVSHYILLLKIALQEDIDKKEMMLDKWFDENKPVSEAYGIRASIAENRNSIHKAKYNYEKSIELNNENFVSLNNYGFLLLKQKEDYEKAKELFEKAIELSPELNQARLNLGVLLSRHFKDEEKAKEQYERIISYDPTEYRAYSNLANYYKFKPRSKENDEKICQLYEKAISLNVDFFDARFAYGNFLSEQMGLHEHAKFQYNEMKRIESNSKDLVEVLIERANKLYLEKDKTRKISRNDSCFCGSGKKYKKCHMTELS